MNTNCTVSCRSMVPTRRTKARALYLGLCALSMAVAASAGTRIITFDAPGAGTMAGQGTGCFAGTDCSVLINNFGAITGYYLDANNVYHGFVRSPDGKFTSFEAPGADTTPDDFNGTYLTPSTTRERLREPTRTRTMWVTASCAVPRARLRHSTFLATVLVTPIRLPLTWNRPSSVITGTRTVGSRFLTPRRWHVRNLERSRCMHGAPAGGFCGGTAAFSINVFGTVAGGYEDNRNLVDHGLIRTPEGKLQTFSVPSAGTGSGTKARAVPVVRARSICSGPSRATTSMGTMWFTATCAVQGVRSQRSTLPARAPKA